MLVDNDNDVSIKLCLRSLLSTITELYLHRYLSAYLVKSEKNKKNTQFLLLLTSIDIGKGKLTVGKIYGGLLILENWKQTKFGSFPTQKVG